MKLLAIDTVTEGCSAALLSNNKITEQYEITPRGHSQRILPMIDELLGQADLKLSQLDAIVMDRGPGSFTGVRICVSVVQGLAFATELPVISISSLAALAQAAYLEQGSEQVLAVIDARMGEVYWGHYQFNNGRMCLQGSEAVSTVATIKLPPGEWLAFGSGCQTYPEDLSVLNGVHCLSAEREDYPRATSLLELARFDWLEKNLLSAEQAQPVYLRDNVAQKPKQKMKPVG
ncbi:tRNA threonylcarbamoyladenosine biosynthesis protein TsaB [hydrothermal vent metagenome]|uniref:tRNA threonylcarbamoyladenosine biosynthesis protein TsaB n=1 Tax=hydrothermal vent metagenome TaxID=652676 RepID=A0A3B1BM68_9ZZZZ